MIHKLLWYLGYNNLGLILDQERKHWLLKTDKKKQVQDKNTGDLFQGYIDNRGSDVIIKSEKLPIKYDYISSLKFTDTGSNKILDFSTAAFPFSMGMPGFAFARIISVNYPFESNDSQEYKNYRIVFNNATTRTVAFGISPNSSEVYSGKWIETSTPPTLQMMDSFGDYSIEVALNIKDSTHSKFYFPLEEGLQPFTIERQNASTYVSEAINDNKFIGYPLFWFNNDQTKSGPYIGLGNNGYNSSNMAYMIFSTPGNTVSMYNGNAYVNVDGTSTTGSTPDLSLPDDWEIRCKCNVPDGFTNTDADFELSINIGNIYFYNKTSGTTTNIPIVSGNGENNVFKMTKNVGWVFEDSNTYKIDMDLFTSNNSEQSGDINPLTPLFDIYLDTSISFYTNDETNVGFAGIEFTSSNPMSDTIDRYPYDLDKWDGLPEWIQNPEMGVSQHMAIYAIHNSPEYTEENPESRQVAALILDPGRMKTSESEGLENDERGRIYVISNDEAEYRNNATTDYPKPARTLARICDIPTSVSDFLNVEGLVPISIVDSKYVRSQAAYTTSEKERLWNTLNSKIVTPLANDEFGNPFYTGEEDSREKYPYIFQGIENLLKVDLIDNNDFREWINLNSFVDPSDVSVYSIANRGSDYTVNATGIVIIGGVAMNYIVNEVDENGGVIDVEVVPQDDSTFINLSNFDMVDGSDGITQKYGTTPAAGEHEGTPIPKVGEGLEIVLIINNYDQIKTKRGNIYDNLVAFVYEDSYLKMYRYVTNSSNPLHIGRWTDPMIVTYYDNTNPIKSDGGYSSTDAMTRLLVPYIKTISVCSEVSGESLKPITAMTTPTFINIIDQIHTPIHLSGEDTLLSRVDLCGFHCDNLSQWIRLEGENTSEEIVMNEIKNLVSLDRDCYLIWQWRNDEHKDFRFGIVRRSLNNYVTTDTTTTIPPTPGMKYDSFVNTNASTTVVWDVPNFGPMTWVYNPNYNKKEIYNIDQNTRDLYISYSNEDKEINPNIMSWEDVDIRTSPYGNIEESIITDGVFNFYIYTNNPIQGEELPSSGVYNEYEFVKLVSQGDEVTPTTPTPVGNWQLVFPRVNQYKIISTGIQNGVYNSEVKLRRLIPLRGEDLGTVSNVLDEKGNNINSKVVLFDQGSSGTKMKIYNKETNRFETV